jgi:DNA-binding NarL/FixJ family response regulator
LKKPFVAIVDDEKPARDRMRRLVEALPEVEIVGEAGDVAEAVALVNRERPDLLLLDVQIPGGDGFDVLRQVAHTPQVVFTTAFDHYARALALSQTGKAKDAADEAEAFERTRAPGS